MQNKFHSSLFLSHQPICEGKLHYFAELQSTSDYAKQLVQNGADSGTLVIAEHQTSGRGRGGNQWQSPAGDGLLFTLVIDPDIDPLYWSRFSIVAGVAIAKAIESLSKNDVKVQLKWPNDVYINNKKCAGILTEIVSDKVLIGIGINVSTTDFPEQIAHKATSLSREGITLDRELFLAEIVKQIFTLGSMADQAFAHIIEMHHQQCMLRGKLITFLSGDQKHIGKALRLDSQGALVIELPDQTIRTYMEARDILIIE